MAQFGTGAGLCDADVGYTLKGLNLWAIRIRRQASSPLVAVLARVPVVVGRKREMPEQGVV